MLGLLLSWFLIFIVAISFGHLFFSLYFFSVGEKMNIDGYTILDIIFLGLSFLLIPLSLLSFFYPCNYNALLAILLVSALYWFLQRHALIRFTDRVKRAMQNYSLIDYLLFSIIFFSIVFLCIWIPNSEYDPRYYHYQNILFNEQYKIIPGLANLEDRFGFNSNYFLISSVFTMRDLFGVPIYGLQSFVFLLLALWVGKEVIDSKGEATRLFLLFALFCFLYVIWTQLSDTSTDIVPSILVFYLIAKCILYPDAVRKQPSVFVILPVAIVTFKLSYAFIGLIMFTSLWALLRGKKYKSIVFVSVISCLIFFLWTARNVIISGYLIYPLHELDLFSVDWKIPIRVASIQRDFIGDAAQNFFKYYINSMPFPEMPNRSWLHNYIPLTTLIIEACFASVLVIGFTVFRAFRKGENKIAIHISILTVILLGAYIQWFVSAPTFRFISGIAFSILFLAGYCTVYIYRSYVRHNSSSSRSFKLRRYTIFAVTSFVFLFFATAWIRKSFPDFEKSLQYNSYTEILKRPLSVINDIKVHEPGWRDYGEFYLGDVLIYTKGSNTYNEHIVLDKAPSIVFIDFDSEYIAHGRIFDIHSIENRGQTIEEGFRPTKDLKLRYLHKLLYY